MKKGKSKAFTLTELLVVVVVIGVLSAVVLPKYSKVIETRRTTEAEELMGAIRTEQEKRCALDKEYLMKFDGLKDIVKNPDTKNYKLALASTGINATRNDKYSYTLEMPSYADGRICCSGADCEKLNKNYPTCDDLKNKSKTPDYQDSPASCAGKVEEPPTPPTPCEKDPTSCECNPNQAKCCPEGTTWNGTSCVPCNTCDCAKYAAEHAEECSTERPKTCTGEKPSGLQPCNGCGLQTCAVTCNTKTGEWETGECGSCDKTVEECDNQDCCADDFTGDFTACIAKKHGYDSPEYICAKGSLGIGSGAYQCTGALGLGSGRGLDYALTDCQRNPAFTSEVADSAYQYCKSWQELNNSWLTDAKNGFKRYACNGKKPSSPPSTGSGSTPSKPTTCTIKSVTSKRGFFQCGYWGTVCEGTASTSTTNALGAARIYCEHHSSELGVGSICSNDWVVGKTLTQDHGQQWSCVTCKVDQASPGNGWWIEMEKLYCETDK